MEKRNSYWLFESIVDLPLCSLAVNEVSFLQNIHRTQYPVKIKQFARTNSNQEKETRMKKHSKSLRAFTVMALFSLVMVMLFVVASGSVSLASATAATDTAVTNTANDELNETAVYII